MLRSGRTAPATAIHKYKLNLAVRGGPRRVHAFLEGQNDESYYSHHINTANRSIDLYFYRCRNKDGVYQTHEAIIQSGTSPENICIFFVDRDFSEFLAENRAVQREIYVTDYYAIENHLICRDLFSRVWNELVRINRVSLNAQTIIDQFESSLKFFHKRVRVVMYWELAMRRAGHKPIMSNVDLGELFYFDDAIEPYRNRAILRTLEAATKCSTPPNFGKELRQAAREVCKSQPKNATRGKFEVWFFIEFLNRVIATAHRLAQEVNGSVNIKTQIHSDNFVEINAARQPCPEGLSMFLSQHIGA